MYSNIRSFALCALWATSALAAPSVERAAFVRCGTNNPPAALVQQAQQLAVKPEPQAAALATLTVNAYFHVVESAAKRGSVTQTQLNNQVRSMCLSHYTLHMTNMWSSSPSSTVATTPPASPSPSSAVTSPSMINGPRATTTRK